MASVTINSISVKPRAGDSEGSAAACQVRLPGRAMAYQVPRMAQALASRTFLSVSVSVQLKGWPWRVLALRV